MSFLMLPLLIAVNVQMGVTDYQKVAEGLPWTWSDEKATLEYCLKKPLGDYLAKQADGRVRIVRGDDVAYSLPALIGSVFAVDGDRLYLALLSPACSGCRVMAVDLRTGKELWNVPLKAIGLVAHSAYHNAANIETDGKTITIWGKESFGRYVEIRDAKTGKMVGHKMYRGR